MPTARIGKTFTFEAMHHLPNHAGKCRRPHGHSYKVELVVSGAVAPPRGNSDDGMVIDFDALKVLWAPLHEQLDHHNLNEQLPDEYQPTTAENIARFIFDSFVGGLAVNRLPVNVELVRVWETATGYAECYG